MPSRRPTAGWRSSPPTTRRRSPCGGLAIATFCACRRGGRLPSTKCGLRARLASVLESRYRAILNPQLMVDRAGLFRGAIEDRYVGAFFDGTPYSPRADGGALGACRRGARDAARGGALELREQADFDRRAAARGRRGPGRRLSGRRARLAALHRRAYLDQELLPARRRPAHGVSRRARRPAARHRRHRPLGRAVNMPRRSRGRRARGRSPRMRAATRSAATSASC